MANEVFSTSSVSADDARLWSSLKRAIATSPGFQRWKSERAADNAANPDQSSLDQLVRRYLRETLETLAY